MPRRARRFSRADSTVGVSLVATAARKPKSRDSTVALSISWLAFSAQTRSNTAPPDVSCRSTWIRALALTEA